MSQNFQIQLSSSQMVFIQGRRKKMVLLEELGPTLFFFWDGEWLGSIGCVHCFFFKFTNGAKVVSISRQILT